jgi:hypothetical protein
VLDYQFNEAHPDVWTPSPLGGTRFDGWTRFTLLEPLTGQVLRTGGKSSFCMVNIEPLEDGTNPPTTLGGCQGLDQGWADVYGIGLACQFIDVTGVPAGTYLLRQETNFRREIPESDYTNNSTQELITVP